MLRIKKFKVKIKEILGEYLIIMSVNNTDFVSGACWSTKSQRIYLFYIFIRESWSTTESTCGKPRSYQLFEHDIWLKGKNENYCNFKVWRRLIPFLNIFYYFQPILNTYRSNKNKTFSVRLIVSRGHAENDKYKHIYLKS